MKKTQMMINNGEKRTRKRENKIAIGVDMNYLPVSIIYQFISSTIKWWQNVFLLSFSGFLVLLILPSSVLLHLQSSNSLTHKHTRKQRKSFDFLLLLSGPPHIPYIANGNILSVFRGFFLWGWHLDRYKSRLYGIADGIWVLLLSTLFSLSFLTLNLSICSRSLSVSFVWSHPTYSC